jgi:hypothetical protein
MPFFELETLFIFLAKAWVRVCGIVSRTISDQKTVVPPGLESLVPVPGTAQAPPFQNYS